MQGSLKEVFKKEKWIKKYDLGYLNIKKYIKMVATVR